MPLKKFVITHKSLKKLTAHRRYCSKLLCLTSHSIRVLFIFRRLMRDRPVKLSILPLAVPHQPTKNPGGERARGRLAAHDARPPCSPRARGLLPPGDTHGGHWRRRGRPPGATRRPRAPRPLDRGPPSLERRGHPPGARAAGSADEEQRCPGSPLHGDEQRGHQGTSSLSLGGVHFPFLSLPVAHPTSWPSRACGECVTKLGD